jgi:hypothetical protein
VYYHKVGKTEEAKRGKARQDKARQGMANILNVLILYKENLLAFVS